MYPCSCDPACRLAEKIRAARVNKERALQLQEKAQIAAQEAEYDKVYDTVSSRTQHTVHSSRTLAMDTSWHLAQCIMQAACT